MEVAGSYTGKYLKPILIRDRQRMETALTEATK
ncbi:UvrABC system protein A OS=Lysinibacillus sphaericus OX=1421 GN=uvrA PE=3 SV=1 [Lysinibacillus sphaericus]